MKIVALAFLSVVSMSLTAGAVASDVPELFDDTMLTPAQIQAQEQEQKAAVVAAPAEAVVVAKTISDGVQRPVAGVYKLKTTVKGNCLPVIKVYYSEDLDQVDILGTHPGEVVLQMADINQGKKTFAVKSEKSETEYVGLQRTTTTMGNGSFSYTYLGQGRYGGIDYDVTAAGNFNKQSITFAVTDINKVSRKYSEAKKVYSCIYIRD